VLFDIFVSKGAEISAKTSAPFGHSALDVESIKNNELSTPAFAEMTRKGTFLDTPE
jgi:hypothetical protein